MVAPVNLRERKLDLIQTERLGTRWPDDRRRICSQDKSPDRFGDSLTRSTGHHRRVCRIDLIVRGSLHAAPGSTRTVGDHHVRSIVGQFLEHSRIFYFANGGDDDVYIGSADWMTRNLESTSRSCDGPILDVNLKRQFERCRSSAPI